MTAHRCGVVLVAAVLASIAVCRADDVPNPAESERSVVVEGMPPGTMKIITVPGAGPVPSMSKAWSADGSPKPPEAGVPSHPEGPEKPGAGEASPKDAEGKEKPGEKPGEKQATVKRPTEPAAPADPRELSARPDESGVVRFQFRGQAWPDLLEWLGEISGLSVDWQELPSDYVNLSTQRGYTVDEVRDLLNRHLLARGFTMLKQDEFLIVVKCEGLSVGLVPRIAPEELERRDPHEYVRVTFALDWLLADEAVNELQPLLSANGKLFPLAATNRIEAMDAVANLRQIQRVLTEEQSVPEGEPRLVHEFVLRYARADEVQVQLEQFLGTDTRNTGSGTRGSSPQQFGQQQEAMMRMQQHMQEQMQQQMQRQMQQQMQQMQAGQPPGRPGRAGVGPASQEKPVRLLVNRRRNSLLVHAPPDKMALISDAVTLLDVPEQGDRSLQAFLGRMQVYRLAQLDPRKLVQSLQELGGMDPATRLEVDDANRAIIAYATPADHFTIRSTIEKLDGSARRVEVIPLRDLAADEVAGTIQFLMSGSTDRNSSRNAYPDYSWGYPRRSRDDEPTDGFRVDADVMNNRLLVRANDMELEEVLSILVKLGEIPAPDRLDRAARVLNVFVGDDPAAFFQQLQRNWKAVAPNPLQLPSEADMEAVKRQSDTRRRTDEKGPAETKSTVEESIDGEAAEQGNPAQDGPSSAKSAATAPGGSDGPPSPASVGDVRSAGTLPTPGLFTTALWQKPAEAPAALDPATVDPAATDSAAADSAAADSADLNADPPPAPVVVSLDAEGRLVVTSRDAAAVRLLEDLAARLAPPRRDYELFRLKNAPAGWVKLNLEEFFEDDESAGDRSRDRMMSMIFGYPSPRSESQDRRLSQRRKLRFISDLDTNTILVQGASAEQLRTIAELIELYDVPEPVNVQNARITRLFPIRFSRASVVADTVKDAYRDLLSDNDKALQQNRPGGPPERGFGGSGMSFIAGFGVAEGGESKDRTSVRFKGKLSIGVDDITNTLLVSTEGENLMRVVAQMIDELDEAARPVSNVSVIALQRGTDGSRVQKALEKVLGGKSTPSDNDRPGPPFPPGPPFGMEAPRMGMPRTGRPN
ncbi:MAG: hypothetical protein FJ276_19775 [Planctomycetes bacterium]|nr:hypothetical protein [Planctomycetota bacterium]